MNISHRPAKQFLYNNLYKAFKMSEGKEIGLDIACGYMNFRPRFLTDRYIGVDLDEERIKTALTRYPENTESMVCKIEDMPSDLRGDFVACIQTIGANQHFVAENTMICVKKIVEATRKGGTLLFNIGDLSSSYHEEIKTFLDKNFEKAEVMSYGAFNAETFRPVSFVLAYAMQIFPFLRTTGSARKYLYICQTKK